MNGLIKFISDVRLELSKVTWPKRDNVVKLTAIVLLFTAAMGLYAGGLDFAFVKLLGIFVAK